MNSTLSFYLVRLHLFVFLCLGEEQFMYLFINKVSVIFAMVYLSLLSLRSLFWPR